MIYTFEIKYEGIDTFENIQFCAENESEALDLFNDWCCTDNKLKTSIEPSSVQIVYNECDAVEYGFDYGVNRDGRVIFYG